MEKREPYFGSETPPLVREERPVPRMERPSAAIPALIGAAVALAIAGGAAYFFWPRPSPAPDSPQRTAASATPDTAEAQAPRHPIANEPVEEPLPALKESDGSVAAALASLVGQDAFGRVFLTENLVRNIVASVDNLPRETVARRVNPLQAVPGVPATRGSGANLTLAPANAARYALQMQLVESVGTDKIVAFYRRHYPLFQQAYAELGYPKGYFNDRLVEAIDDLLATPDPPEPIRLTQPKVLYEFADESLEERSAGQKMMLRIGKENRDRVKAKLREIRAAIAKP